MKDKVLENAIKDIELKEYFGDTAISILTKEKLIDYPKDLNHLVVEFAYLLVNDKDEPTTTFKVITPKRLFNPSKIFYFSYQEGKLFFLSEEFTEEVFKELQTEMFIRNKIDILSINWNDYKMELY